jgi:serine protease Do
MARTLRLAVPLAAALAAGGCSSATFTADFGDCTPVGAHTLGTTTTGTLVAADCAIPADGTPADFYTLTLTQQRNVTLTLRSADFDAFLLLLDAEGALVRADDDSGSGTAEGQSLTDARIQVTLEAGEYRIGVNTAGEDDGGAYTLVSSQ